jgi:hypothetical protein
VLAEAPVPAAAGLVAAYTANQAAAPVVPAAVVPAVPATPVAPAYTANQAAAPVVPAPVVPAVAATPGAPVAPAVVPVAPVVVPVAPVVHVLPCKKRVKKQKGIRVKRESCSDAEALRQKLFELECNVAAVLSAIESNSVTLTAKVEAGGQGVPVVAQVNGATTKEVTNAGANDNVVRKGAVAVETGARQGEAGGYGTNQNAQATTERQAAGNGPLPVHARIHVAGRSRGYSRRAHWRRGRPQRRRWYSRRSHWHRRRGHFQRRYRGRSRGHGRRHSRRGRSGRQGRSRRGYSRGHRVARAHGRSKRAEGAVRAKAAY